MIETKKVRYLRTENEHITTPNIVTQLYIRSVTLIIVLWRGSLKKNAIQLKREGTREAIAITVEENVCKCKQQWERSHHFISFYFLLTKAKLFLFCYMFIQLHLYNWDKSFAILVQYVQMRKDKKEIKIPFLLVHEIFNL